MKKMKEMQRYKWVAMLAVAITMVGCVAEEDETHRLRKQLLEAQQVSIDSVEREITRIRDGNGSDMSKWSPDTIKLYQAWQSTLVERYAEREKLINSISGSTLNKMSAATAVPQDPPETNDVNK